jgi:hypothetical protein
MLNDIMPQIHPGASLSIKIDRQSPHGKHLPEAGAGIASPCPTNENVVRAILPSYDFFLACVKKRKSDGCLGKSRISPRRDLLSPWPVKVSDRINQQVIKLSAPIGALSSSNPFRFQTTWGRGVK